MQHKLCRSLRGCATDWDISLSTAFCSGAEDTCSLIASFAAESKGKILLFHAKVEGTEKSIPHISKERRLHCGTECDTSTLVSHSQLSLVSKFRTDKTNGRVLHSNAEDYWSGKLHTITHSYPILRSLQSSRGPAKLQHHLLQWQTQCLLLMDSFSITSIAVDLEKKQCFKIHMAPMLHFTFEILERTKF